MFDREGYLSENPDVAVAGVDPWEHFCSQGWREGRVGGMRVPTDFVLSAVQEAVGHTEDPIGTWIRALDRRDDWAMALLRIDNQSVGNEVQSQNSPLVPTADGSDQSNNAQSAPNEHRSGETRPQSPPRATGASTGVATEPTPAGAPTSLSPGDRALLRAAFDDDYYRRQLGHDDPLYCSPLDHYLAIGWLEGRDPNPEFSTAYYLWANRDIREAGINPFLHFLRHGRNEGWRKSMPSAAGKAILRAQDGDLRELLDELGEFEPEIPLALRNLSPAGTLQTETALASTLGQARELLGSRRWANLVFVPHWRWPGAPRTAAELVHALVAKDPGDTCVVQTDLPSTRFIDLLPKEAVSVDISTLLEGLSGHERALLILDIIRGTEADHVYNVNSKALWDALLTHGRHISDITTLVSYLFTWEVGADGLRAGYPIQHLNRTIAWHDGVLTDSRQLRDEIQGRFALPTAFGPRVAWLRTSLDLDNLDVQLREWTSDGVAARSPQREVAPRATSRAVLWAGRLDRQKNFPLLLEIAEAAPQYTFVVFGEKVLKDDGMDIEALPSNVNLMGTFTHPGEVLAQQPFAYLHTALWEGTPLGLLEMAYLGLPVVATTVGGIADVVHEGTGWPISPDGSANEFVRALREIEQNPASAKQRVSMMRAFIRDEHSRPSYRNGVDDYVQTLDSEGEI